MSLPTSNNAQPQQELPPNPFLTAYETFVRDTPLVTRYVLTTLFCSWMLSFFLDTTLALSNIPYMSIFYLELYRMILSPVVCSSIMSLGFAYMGFVDNGKRLEYSMGSTRFGCLLLTVGCLTNSIFVVVSFLLYGITGEMTWLFGNSSGIWLVLFGIIAIECAKAPQDSQRRFFSFSVPTIYYPLILVGIFSLLGGVAMCNFISLAIGYAHGYGYLERFQISSARCKTWEDTILANFTRREGWVVGHAASGSTAWTDAASTAGIGLSNFALPAVARPPATGGGDSSTSHRNSTTPTTPQGSEFPAGGGKTLGGGPARRLGGGDTADARASRLAALGAEP